MTHFVLQLQYIPLLSSPLVSPPLIDVGVAVWGVMYINQPTYRFMYHIITFWLL